MCCGRFCGVGFGMGRLLGQEKPFMHEMVWALRDEMVAAYPELNESAQRVAKVVLAEEEQFARCSAKGSLSCAAELKFEHEDAASALAISWLYEMNNGLYEQAYVQEYGSSTA